MSVRPVMDQLSEIRDDVAPLALAEPVSEPIAKSPSLLRRVIRKPTFLLAALVVLFILTCAVAPALVSRYDPLQANVAIALQPPSLTHLFGTDELGRDLFSRMVWGARLTLLTTTIAVAIGLVVGGVIGLISGYCRGSVDNVIMRLVDVLLSIPSLLLAMALVTALGFGPIQLSVAVGVALIGSSARVMRSEVLHVSKETYVDAERAIGAPAWYIVGRHVLPNAAGPVLALAVIEFAQAILAIAALSFLGFGTPPPDPEWGSIVASGQRFFATAWWLTMLPGLMVAVVVISVNRLGRSLEMDRA
jgi:peptide/nickel transport system permease protein